MKKVMMIVIILIASLSINSTETFSGNVEHDSLCIDIYNQCSIECGYNYSNASQDSQCRTACWNTYQYCLKEQ